MQPALSQGDSPLDILGQFGINETEDTRPAPPIHMKQLQLIVQWQTSTYRFFAPSAETEDIWQRLMVEEALRTPMLMHGILGVSALHLELSRDSRERSQWVDLAVAHNAGALRSFVKSLPIITETNEKTRLGFSGLVVAHAFGAAMTDITAKPSLDALINVFTLCRVVLNIIGTTSDTPIQGSFAPLFDLTAPTVVIPDNVLESLENLERLNKSMVIKANHDFDTYTKAIGSLKHLAARTFSQTLSVTLAAGMPIQCFKPYIDYVKQRQPMSLLILAHYCAFLHMTDWNMFIQPWGSHVLRDICASLDHDWKRHIVWPIQIVFGEIMTV